MTRVFRIVLVALVLTAVSASQAAQETSSFTSAVVLRPTDHPRVPRELSQFWMVPDKGRVRTVAQANLAAAVKFENDGSHAKAFALLSTAATKQDRALAAYAEYYKGLALLRLDRAAEARATFRALRSTSAIGYLAEMAALREAECDEALGDQAGAIAVYEQLTLTRTLAPDDILMKLGRAAQMAGESDRARAAFERLYYEYPLSDFADEAEWQLSGTQTAPTSIKFKQDLGRAERLFAAKMYTPARSTFERLRELSDGEDRNLIRLRLAECDYFLRRYRASADALRPFVDTGTRTAEALYYYGLTQRELNNNALFRTLLRRVVTEFPGTVWAEHELLM